MKNIDLGNQFKCNNLLKFASFRTMLVFDFQLSSLTGARYSLGISEFYFSVFLIVFTVDPTSFNIPPKKQSGTPINPSVMPHKKKAY